MSIEAINEQLLRAIGVGVALLDSDTLNLVFQNDTFKEWFGVSEPGRALGDLFPDFDAAAVRAALDANGRHHAETTFRLRRRTMTVAMSFNRALDGDRRLAVLVCQNITRIKELESMIDSYSMMVERNTREIKREKEQVEKLLLNIMPRAAYEEYKSFGVVAPRRYDPVTVVYLDFADFAEIVAAHDPGVVVSELNDIYSAFDRIGEQFGCERIKTVGDVYISVSGMLDDNANHAGSAASAAIRFLRYLNQRNASHPIRWHCRIGLSTGAVIGSVIGVRKYIYDVFGPAVIDAARLHQFALPMRIVGNAAFAETVRDRFTLTRLALVDDGRGGAAPVFSLDAEQPAALDAP